MQRVEREASHASPLRLPPAGHYARITAVVVLVLAGFAAAWQVRNILLLVLIAAVLAVGLEPAVRRLERMHLSRGWAVLVIILSTIGFFVLFGLLVIPPLVREVKQLASDIPGYIARLQHDNGFFGDLERKYHISQKLQALIQDLPSKASSSLGTILGFTKSIASMIFNSLTVTILTIYFLVAAPKLRALALALIRTDEGDRVFDEALAKIGGYVSGNITISIIAGVTAWIALTIMGVPFAAALAMWVAIADLIPTVGATLGAVPAVIVAAFSSVGDGIATTAYFLIYQQVENYVISPRVMAKAVDLSPAAVIVSVLIGGSLAGFAGALLALPLAAAAKVAIRDLWLGRRLDVAEAQAKVIEAEDVGRGAQATSGPDPPPAKG
jgi:predicted PurR-regulated permease PerM